MNDVERGRWQGEALDRIFEILAATPAIAESLIFKGARALNLHLGMVFRQSYDLDSNVSVDFIQRRPDPNEQQTWLQNEIASALRRGFERENPVCYRLEQINVSRNPPKPHPLGWDAFEIILNVQDLRRSTVRGFPRLEIDIAAPEELDDQSIVTLQLVGSRIRAYSLERIAGEKLRAFLTSLPAYNAKIGRKPRAQRVKDVYDLARILLYQPISNRAFWKASSEQFRMACRSRFVDCSGIGSFEQELTATRTAYEQDRTLPKDIGFDEAWTGLRSIVETWIEIGIVPLAFPLPHKE